MGRDCRSRCTFSFYCCHSHFFQAEEYWNFVELVKGGRSLRENGCISMPHCMGPREVSQKFLLCLVVLCCGKYGDYYTTSSSSCSCGFQQKYSAQLIRTSLRTIYVCAQNYDYPLYSPLTKSRRFIYLQGVKNARPEYRAACKNEYRPLN